MTTVETLTLLGLVLGPVAAVGISLWTESRRKRRDQRLVILRALLTTRHLVGDPSYSAAINLIPIEFSDCRSVMDAYRHYIDAVRVQPSPENEKTVTATTAARQTRLIFEVTKAMGFRIAETDLQTTAYAADGWVRRDLTLLDSQKAMRDVATAMFLQTRLLAGGQLTPEERKLLLLPDEKPNA